MSEQNFHLETKLVNLGRPDHVSGAPMNVPIGLSTTFVAGENSHGYIREGTDLTEALESVLGAVDAVGKMQSPNLRQWDQSQQLLL